jgi:hypothetical protein
VDVLSVHEALTDLAQLDLRQADHRADTTFPLDTSHSVSILMPRRPVNHDGQRQADRLLKSFHLTFTRLAFEDYARRIMVIKDPWRRAF